jgi:hypothetical protein
MVATQLFELLVGAVFVDIANEKSLVAMATDKRATH